MPSKSLAALLKEYEDYTSFGDQERERHYFPSGILALNYIVADNNGKGIPGGSIVQLLGEPTHGKSTIALDYIAEAQKTKLKEIEIPDRKGTRIINAAIIDFEHSFDKKYAELLGVDTSKLFVISPEYAENGFNLAEGLLQAGLQIMVVDSVGMLVSASEEDKDFNDNEKIGSEAKVLGRFLKRANGLVDVHNSVLFIINQYRANLSPMARSDKKPYGARILQYAVKITIKVTRIGEKDGRIDTELFVEKTKLGQGKLKAHFDFLSGQGIDKQGHLLTLAAESGIVGKNKGWYDYNGIKANGIENSIEKFPMTEIEQKLKDVLSNGEAENQD